MAGSDVIELSPSSRFHREPAQPTESVDDDSTFAERLLSDVIADCPGPLIREDDQYKGEGDEDAQSVAQIFVYQRLTSRSNLKLELHLENSPAIQEKLGIGDVLDHTSYARAWREQFSPGTREYLEAYCGWIQEELADIDERLFDPFLPREEPPEHEQLPEIPDGEIDSAIEHVRDIMLGTTDFDRASNTTYDDSEILEIAMNACRERGEINTVIDDYDPWLKTIMNAIQNRSGEEWQDSFETINERVLDAAKGAGMLDRPVEGYLDITIIPFYPQNLERPNNARGNANKNGTMHGFHFATMVAHDKDHNKDLAVAVTPYTPEMGPYDLVVELVEQAEEHCSLESVFLDSDFATARIINYLDEKSIGYITRLKRRGPRIKGVLASMDGRYNDWEDYSLNSTENNIYVNVRVVAEPDWDHATAEALRRQIDSDQSELSDYGDSGATPIPDVDDLDKEMWMCRRPYATNITDVEPEKLMKRYKMRWRVENSYADKKRALLGKTQSRDHGTRVFLFWLTSVLYNGWMLTRAFLRLDFPNHHPQDRPPVKARDFMKKILGIGYG